MAKKGEKVDTVDPEKIRDISEKVYRMQLELPSGGGPGACKRMIEKDGDNGEKLRNRAGQLDVATRLYLDVLKVRP